jgi:hypothetical protein
MLKLRSFHIFMLAMTILFGAVLDRGFHLASLHSSNTTKEAHQDYEDLGPESKYYPVLLSFIELDLSSLFSITDAEIHFDIVNSVKNINLPQLLGSHRIALPPPYLA